MFESTLHTNSSPNVHTQYDAHTFIHDAASHLLYMENSTRDFEVQFSFNTDDECAEQGRIYKAQDDGCSIDAFNVYFIGEICLRLS